MAIDGVRSGSAAPPSDSALAWRRLGYPLLALAWTLVAGAVVTMWVLTLVWVLGPSEVTGPSRVSGPDVVGTLVAALLFALILLAVPATVSEAVFCWIFAARALGARDRGTAIAVNVGSRIRPLFVPRRTTAFSRMVLVVFDLSWVPSWRIAAAALVSGLCGAGAILVRNAPPAAILAFAVVALAVLAAVVRTVWREVRARHSRAAAEHGRAARSAVRAERNARKRATRRGELLELRVTDRSAFDAALLVEVDREVARRVHHVRRIQKAEKAALDILVGNVVYAMVGTVADAEARALVLRRALEIQPVPRPPRAP